MDTTTQSDLHQIHKAVFTDLTKLGQLIDPCNDRAMAIVSQALEHLCDLEELADNGAGVKDSDPPLVGLDPELEFVDGMHQILDKAKCSALMLGAAALSVASLQPRVALGV